MSKFVKEDSYNYCSEIIKNWITNNLWKGLNVKNVIGFSMLIN